MMSRKCLACSRLFPPEHTQCYQCLLPLYDTAETEAIQSIELGRIMGIMMRRYSNALKRCRPVGDDRPDPEPMRSLGRYL